MSKPADYVVVMTGGAWWFPHSLGPSFLRELITSVPSESITKADGSRPVYHIYILVGMLPEPDTETAVTEYLAQFPDAPVKAQIFPLQASLSNNVNASTASKMILERESRVDLVVINASVTAKSADKSDVGGGLLLKNSLVFNLASPVTLIHNLLPVINSAVVLLVGSEVYRKVDADFFPAGLKKISSVDSFDPEALFMASRFL